MNDFRDDLPVMPNPHFAARCARLGSVLTLPNRTAGVDVSDADVTKQDAQPADGSTVPPPAALPHLTVDGTDEAINWNRSALGAVLVGEPIVASGGRVGHAELAIGGGTVFLADEYLDFGLKATAPQAFR